MSKLDFGNSPILNSDIVVNGAEVKTGATYNGKAVYCKAFQPIADFTATANTYTAKNFTVSSSATEVLLCHAKFKLKIGTGNAYYYNDKMTYVSGTGIARFAGLTAIGDTWGSFDVFVTDASTSVSDITIIAWYTKD